MKRFYLLMGLCLAALAAVEVVLCRVLQIEGMGRAFTGSWPTVFVCTTFALAASPFPRMREVPALFLLSSVNWTVLVILSMAATRAVAAVPLNDRRLSAIDAALGFKTANLVHLVRQHPWLDALSTQLYWNVLLVEVMAVVLVPALIGHAESGRRYIAAIAIGVLITSAASLFSPAIGPWTVQDYTPTAYQSGWTHYILRLRSPGPVMLDMGQPGVISFPSFHCTFAILTAYGLSCIRWLRWPLRVTAALICISTLTTGSHYLVDVLGGVAVAFTAIWAARHLALTARTCRPRMRPPYS